jgi:hypothetical protein
VIWGRSTSGDVAQGDWLRRSGWRASVTSGLAAVLAAGLVSGSRDPVVDVLAGAQAAPPSSGTTPPVSLPAGPHLPWPHARSTVTAASTSRRTTPAALVDAQDIPAVALVAYQRAALVVDAADTSCRLDWALLAAIGRVESDHGRVGGSSLDAQGVDRPAVLGPRLDGQHGTTVVRDTDAGRLDHDHTYDRAVGPMQFLPSTWSVVAVDGDADGRRDVQDIDDAALGSAVYLCVGGSDLSTVAGQRAAVYRYNHSAAYVADVLAIARAYRAGSPFVQPVSMGPLGTVQPVAAVHPRPVEHATTPATNSGPTPAEPTRSATTSPAEPSTSPTTEPTGSPSPSPSGSPSSTPSELPSESPSASPSESPSESPSTSPTESPSTSPSESPSASPSESPTESPSGTPSESPSTSPSESPTESPSGTPSESPSSTPSETPSPSPTEPPIVPEVRPTALVGLSVHQVRLIDEAWPVCRDRLPTTWTEAALLRCLSTETGFPRHDTDLVVFVHWLARHEADLTSGR